MIPQTESLNGPTMLAPCRPKNQKNPIKNETIIIATKLSPNARSPSWIANSNNWNGLVIPAVLNCFVQKNFIIEITTRTMKPGIIAANALDTAGGTCSGILIVRFFL